MVRVLHELSSLDGGGVAKLLYDYYCHIDREKIHFDFLIQDLYDEGIYEKPLRDLGCNIYKIPRIKKDKRGYLQGMEKTISEGRYDVVHSHMGARGLFTMYYAKKAKVKKRIVHSHIAHEDITRLKRCFDIMLSCIAKANATDLFACGREAGIYMWGKRCSKKGKIKIMTNAVDTKVYEFNAEIRAKKREELGVGDNLVIGIVGRLSDQKNYPFLFKAYKEMLKRRKDVVFVIVGRGLEEEMIKRKARQMELEQDILFLGVRNDVPELMNAFDLFVLPSLYEGLPVVLIEAQANGLKQLVSNRVTDEMEITDLIEFLPIEGTEKLWAEKMESCFNKVEMRKCYSQQVAKAGYDIKLASKIMEEFYLVEEKG